MVSLSIMNVSEQLALYAVAISRVLGRSGSA
jgi:hypothetical protein